MHFFIFVLSRSDCSQAEDPTSALEVISYLYLLISDIHWYLFEVILFLIVVQ